MTVSKIGHNIGHKLVNLATPICDFFITDNWVLWNLSLSRIKLNSNNKVFNDYESIIICLINSKSIYVLVM